MPRLASLVVVAVAIAGCGSSGAKKSQTARTVALVPAAAAAPPGQAPGASGGASLVTTETRAPSRHSVKESTHAVRTHSTTTVTATRTTTSAAPTSAPATTHAATTPTSRRSVRKKEPRRHSSLPPATPSQSSQVVACLTSAGLAHVSADRRIVWTGWDSRTGTFVYVEVFATVPAAAAASHELAPQEAGIAGRYVVHQPIARYAGSPVPVVIGCLTGHPVHKGKPSTKPGSFTF